MQLSASRHHVLRCSLVSVSLCLIGACARGAHDETDLSSPDHASVEPDPASASIPPAGPAPPTDAGDASPSEAAAADATTDAPALGLPASITNGLVLHMALDNGSAVDATGLHPAADVSAMNLNAAPDRFGKATGATRFAPAPPSLVQIGGANMPMGSAARSLAVWVRPRISAPPPPAARPNSNVFVHWGIDDCSSKMFGLGHRNDTGFGWTGCADMSSTLPIPVATWTFVAAMYDAAGTMTLVVDHQRMVSTGVTLGTTAAPLAVGGERKTFGQGFVYYFDGDLDDLRVWSRVLTDAELTALALDR